MAGERLAGPISADILRVIDGDTLDARVTIWLGQTLRVRIRLAGVDAPEMTRTCAHERRLAERARKLVAAAAARGGVQLFDIRRGKYAGRVVARAVGADGDDIGQLLLRHGLAKPYGKRARCRSCTRAERCSNWKRMGQRKRTFRHARY